MAEELAQEALVRVVRDWRKVSRAQSPEAWVHRVAVNLANSFFRRKAAEVRAKNKMRAEAQHAVPPANPDDIALRAEIAKLPRRQKTALVLRYFAGMSVRETAVALDCPEGTVKTLTHKAISSLRGSPLIGTLREVADEQ